MNKKIIIAVISFILAVMAGFGEYMYLQNLNKAQYTVAVAVQEIKPNESLQGKIKYVKTNVSAPNTKITGNEYARVLIPQGSVITEEMVTSEKTNQNLKKVAVKSDLVSAVGGQIKAGTFVDVGFVPQKDYADQYPPGIILHHVQVAGVFNQEGMEMSTKVFGNMQTTSSLAGVILFLNEEDIVKLKDYEAHGTIYFVVDSNQNM
jgi:Flp pilus assembly protein CpaB